MKVMTNRRRPERDQGRPIEVADGLRELVGDRGPRWWCLDGMEVETLCALPMTKVTAMVSPSARPRSSIKPTRV
jgi:hypothetical protein